MANILWVVAFPTVLNLYLLFIADSVLDLLDPARYARSKDLALDLYVNTIL